MNSDTIVAPATPHGIGGIAIVRLSGSRSRNVLHKLLNNSSLSHSISHKNATFLKIYDNKKNLIDETVCTYFKAPNSYTGEDLIEISCHGNPFIVDKIVSTCSFYGARLAGPGEFTRRAFINGKLDLVQAESVISLIQAKSEESSSLNLKILKGELSKNLNNIRNRLIDIASSIEFELDISEDDLHPDLANKTVSILIDLKENIDSLLSSYNQARLLNSGALVVIAGEPNVGKSTLLNALTETNRAITNALPGTTRDAIDVQLILNGVPINLIDTAGIRETNEEIEQEGVRRSMDYIKRADLIIAVYDVSNGKDNKISLPLDIPIIEIINKIDLIDLDISENLRDIHTTKLQISAKTGIGLNELKHKIKQSLGISSSLADTVSITTNRQRIALTNCKNNIKSAIVLLKNDSISYELVSIEIRDALDNIGQILGKTTPDDILNNIFNHFCVGK